MTEWVRAVEGSSPTAVNVSLRNFGNSVYPALPVSFGGDTKNRWPHLFGVYASGIGPLPVVCFTVGH